MPALATQYGADAVAGQLFISSTAATGVTLPIFSNTSQVFSLWNPSGSGKNAYLISCKIGWVSGASTAGNFGYGVLYGAGNALATAAPFSAFTKTAPASCYLTNAQNSSMFVTVSAATLTTAATWLGTMGVSTLATTAATTSAPMWTINDNINGSIVVPPGTAIFVCGSVALTTVATVTLQWEEV